MRFCRITIYFRPYLFEISLVFILSWLLIIALKDQTLLKGKLLIYLLDLWDCFHFSLLIDSAPKTHWVKGHLPFTSIHMQNNGLFLMNENLFLLLWVNLSKFVAILLVKYIMIVVMITSNEFYKFIVSIF